MAIPKSKIRIQIEISCDDCLGTGKAAIPGERGSEFVVECSGCDGTGYQTQSISMDELKEILESGE